MQANSKTYQNKKRKTTLLLKKKNKVYFFIKNLKINKEKNKKLDHVKVESFFIDARIFFVFHVFVLKSIHSTTSI